MNLGLVDHQIKKLIKDGHICHFDKELSFDEHIQPASFDIPAGSKVYAVNRRFSGFLKPVQEIVDAIQYESWDISNDSVTLVKGQTYVLPVLKVDLPDDVKIDFSPKSSIGRVDMTVRMIVDGAGLYDMTPYGYKGDIWMEVTPRSFNIRITQGIPLIQAKLFTDKVSVPNIEEDPDIWVDKDFPPALFDKQTLVLGLNVPKDEILGYTAKDTNKPIDLTKVGEYDPLHFFSPIYAQKRTNQKVELMKDQFYILSTKNFLTVPPKYSAEMLPVSHHIGELRAHYAGFFDPGFGFGTDGSVGGNTGVLEIRPFDTITCYDNQPIALFRYYLNDAECESVYGQYGNNYAKQKVVKLAKYFKDV